MKPTGLLPKCNVTAESGIIENLRRGRCLLQRLVRRSPWSNHFNQIGRHPNIDLLEPGLEPLFAFDEVLPIFRFIGRIDIDSHQVIAVTLTLMPPLPVNDLSVARRGPELLLQFEQCVGDRVVWNCSTVVKPQWQENLETPNHSAHKWVAPRR